MSGKGFIKFFLIVLTVVCIYQLSFTWVASNIEKSAAEYAEKSVDQQLQGEARSEALIDLKSDYLTEKENEIVYNIGIAKYNFSEVKSRALNLGLDLQGGMSVALEVSQYDLIKELSNNDDNPALLAALDKANAEASKGQGNIIDLFVKHYEDANPGANLVTLFKSTDNKDLAVTASNSDVQAFLHTAAENGIQSTYTKLKERIDKFGVASPYIALQKNTGRIIVELPGVDNPKQVRKLLQSTANLQFWETWQYSELAPQLIQMNEVLKGVLEENTAKESEAPMLVSADSISNDTAALTAIEDTSKNLLGLDSSTNILESTDTGAAAMDSTAQEGGPLTKILTPVGGPVLGLVDKRDTMLLMKYFNYPEVKATLPANCIIMLGASPEKNDPNKYAVYAVKPKIDDNAPLLEGDIIRSASQTYDPSNGEAQVTMQMKSDGAKKWRRITADNKGKYIAIVLDNQVYSAPVVNEEIPNGSSVISGSFDVKEAQVLANILETGKLPVPSKIVQESIVGPSLGAEAIRNGILSMIAGLILVVIFMAFYYSTAGVVADIALFANIFFIFGALSSLGATLTLPGIAGLVLTMGMAVDANVIIYERVREELAKGKNTLKAIGDGYRNSYSAIIDSHVTTFVIGIILNSFGSGAIKGFAIVLMIGIVFSLFTAIFISRMILEWMARNDKPIYYYTRFTKGAFKNLNYKFIQKRKYGYIFSSVVTVIGLVFILTSGFNYGVEFKGGRSFIVRFDEKVDADQIRDELSQNFDPAIQVKTFGADINILTTYMISDPNPDADSIATVKLYEQLKHYYPSNPDFNTWDSKYKLSRTKVEPTIAKDIQESAVKSIIVALLCTFIYIFLRFRKWQFGLAAVIALAHDALMTLAMFAILKNVMPFTLQIDESFVAAILTIIGYSIMDTVVVYDRIREFLKDSKSGTVVETFNNAINQTLSRTVITSGVTILSILAILFFGTDHIQGFAFAMFIGIAFGTYSSVFIASALTVDLFKREMHHKTADEVIK